MKSLVTFWRWLRSLGRSRAVKREIDDELRLHLELRTAENIAAGMSPEEAARAARKRFGNLQSVREECRDVRGASFGEAVLRDIRFGLRMLRKSPGFTAAVVLSLALGIGASTAVFSLFKALVLRPLPLEGADRLVDIIECPKERLQQVKFSGNWRRVVAPADFLDWKAQSQSFEDMSTFAAGGEGRDFAGGRRTRIHLLRARLRQSISVVAGATDARSRLPSRRGRSRQRTSRDPEPRSLAAAVRRQPGHHREDY